MKSTITFLFIAISIIAVGQSKIEGIGKFKLGKTTVGYIDTLCQENHFKKIKVREQPTLNPKILTIDYEKLLNNKDQIIEFLPDTIYCMNIYSRLCKKARVFAIPKITISGIVFSKTILTFFDGVLINIRTDYHTEIEDAIKLKYGNPFIMKDKKSKAWKNGYLCCVIGAENENKKDRLITFMDVAYILKLDTCNIQEEQIIKRHQVK